MGKEILFLTSQSPYPPRQGGALRSFGLIKGLAERGHRIALLTFIEPGQPAPADTPLATWCEEVSTLPAPARSQTRRLADFVAGRADMGRRLWSPPFQEKLGALIAAQAFDVIHFESLEMAAYLPAARRLLARRAPDPLLVYNAFNAEYELQERIAAQDIRNPRSLPAAFYSLVQARRLKQFETQICRASGHILACSDADARSLARLPHRTPITVIPNAIEVKEYRLVDTRPADLPHPALVFTGKMDYRPNVDAALWFALEVLPRIQRSVPDAHFTVVGQKPHPRLDRLRELPGVTLTGQVPDIRPFIQAADVYVAPLRMGSGTRLKLLEAMAMERAIVSTRLGAEGLEAAAGEALVIADQPGSFASAVVDLLQDAARRQILGRQASALVRARYDWPVIIPRVEAVYERL